MIRIRKDWWKDFFNDVYMVTDARSICDKELTRREVDLLETTLGLNKRDKLLDLCGGYGRHSLELGRRGYRNVSVLDYSDYLIRLGKRMAKKTGLDIKFYRSDARSTGFGNDSFTAVAVMSNSFGYFPRDDDNLRILKEVRRILKKGGRLLLDLADPEYIKRNLTPVSWHEAQKNIIVCREREMKGDLVRAREIVLSKKDGLIQDKTYCERLYGKKKIVSLLKNAGFHNISIRKRIALHKKKYDYGLLLSKMIITAIKGRGSSSA
ncbi:class I SAM-dependent methyltransferase [Candidatus Omnitrophota bacterium]